MLNKPKFININMETSSDLPRQSSEIFGNFRKNLENGRKYLYDHQRTFSKSLEIFRKWLEIFGKSPKTSLLVGFKKKEKCMVVFRYEFFFHVC